MLLLSASACAAGKEKPFFAQTPNEIFQDERVVELTYAAMNGDAKKINELIESGVDVNSKGNGELNPLTFAMLAQNLRGFEALLDLGADPTQAYSSGRTVVHYIASAHYVNDDFMRALIDHGVDLDATGVAWTPLYEATYDDSLVKLQMMIDAGADIEWRDFSKDTPLLHAAGAGQWSAVVLLLKNGARPDVVDRWDNGLDYFF